MGAVESIRARQNATVVNVVPRCRNACGKCRCASRRGDGVVGAREACPGGGCAYGGAVRVGVTRCALNGTWVHTHHTGKRHSR